MLRPPDPVTQSPLSSQIQEFSSPNKRPRTAEDFLRFCDVVLSYTNYPHAFYQNDEDERKIESPLNSIGESAHVSAASDTSSRTSSVGEADTDEDTWGMVTCWCGKPFAGRPMIECESCLIWLHLSCARVRKSNIPKHFKCAQCKPPKVRRKRQSSENSEVESHMNEISHHSSSTKGTASINGTSSLSATHSTSTHNSAISDSLSNHHRNELLVKDEDLDNDDDMKDKVFLLNSSASAASHHHNKHQNNNSRNPNHHHTNNSKVKNSKSRRTTTEHPRPRSSKKTHRNKIIANDDALSVRLSYNASSPLSSN
ncbi:unnamed protein product [Allacma fusca]|uniref:Zinc finger PHD-type domain-containing protein n=1 Tax=Allacma fusca TaxID=39272 RepID=A0A8J2L812_9HEXA|nr:unnamed protein product [Allacma fusca]